MSAYKNPARWHRRSCLCVFTELKPHRQECLCHQAGKRRSGCSAGPRRSCGDLRVCLPISKMPHVSGKISRRALAKRRREQVI